MATESGSVFDLIVGNENTTLEYLRDFTPASPVNDFHVLPRFSHTDDFALVFSNNPEEVEDYVLGLLFVACFVMSFFTVWGLLLLLFKCLGPKHMGVFSGHPFRNHGTFATVGRMIFSFSTLMVMIFSIILVTKGLTELQTTADTIAATNQDVMKIANEFVGISTNLKLVARDATPVRDELVDFLKRDICPLSPGSATERDIRDIGNVTLVAMEKLSNFIDDQLKDLDVTLKQVQDGTEQVADTVDSVEFTGGSATAVMIPYFIVPALLLVALLLGWFEVYSEGYYCFTTWFLMPLFVLMVIVSYVGAGWVALATEGNADFCSGGSSKTPEGTLQRALWQNNFTEGEFYYDSLMFYSNQCRSESPWDFLEGYYSDLVEGKATLDVFATAVVQTTPEQLSQECGVDYGPTLQLLNQLQTYTSILVDSALRSIDLMSCKNIVPLYTSVLYEGTCENSITGAAWIFACFMTISFFGMLMIMFRGAYYPIWFEDGSKSLDYNTSDEDDAGLKEEVSGEDDSEYVDESMVDTAAFDEDGLDEDADLTLEDGEDNTLEYGEEDESAYEDGGSQFTEEVSVMQ